MMKSDDLGGVIYDDIANVTDNQGQSLPWLEWLLLRNNQAIIKIIRFVLVVMKIQGQD